MSATNAFETAFLGLVFTNAPAANIGDATGLRGSVVLSGREANYLNLQRVKNTKLC